MKSMLVLGLTLCIFTSAFGADNNSFKLKTATALQLGTIYYRLKSYQESLPCGDHSYLDIDTYLTSRLVRSKETGNTMLNLKLIPIWVGTSECKAGESQESGLVATRWQSYEVSEEELSFLIPSEYELEVTYQRPLDW